MKKYWKFAAIIVVIVLSIGTFYVNSATSAEQYPEFVIQTQSGDADEIKLLVLEGSYTDTSSMNYVSTNLKITADGSTYNSRSILDQVIGQPPTVIKELQEEYRTFMRAKKPEVNLFFENDRFLAYADVKYKIGSLRSNDLKFAISILDKSDGNTTSFTIKVPDDDETDHAFVEDVQIVNNELNLITHKMVRNNDTFYDEKHVYTIDISNQKISSHEAIIHVPEGQADSHIDTVLIKTSPMQENEHLIISKTESKRIQEVESDRFEELSQEVISYNLATKEKETIDLPENLNFKENDICFFDGSTIYFTKLDGQNLTVTPFNIEDDQVDNAFSIQLSNETDHVQPPMITVKDGKLYATSSSMNSKANASVIVVDLETGKTLYEGELVRKNSSDNMEEFELYIHDIFVK